MKKMKNKVYIAAAVLVATAPAMMGVPALAAPSTDNDKVSVSAEASTIKLITASLSIRSTPESTGTKLGVISRDTPATITGNVEGKYTEITYNGITGWVETRFVKDYEGELPEAEEPNTPETPETGEKEAVQIIASLSIREKADSTSTRLGVVPRLSIAETERKTEDKYTEITYNGMTGWVETRFVKDYEGELPETEEPSTPEAPVEENTDARRTIIASITLFETGEATKKIGSVARNTNVTATGETSGKYSEISLDGKIGWVETRFVKEYNSEFDLTPVEDKNPSDKNSVAELGKQEVRSPNAYFYEKADAKSVVVAKLPKYSVVEIVEIDGAWAKAKLENNKEGYVVVSHLGEYVADTYSKWRTASKVVTIYDKSTSDRTKVTTVGPNRPIEVLESERFWSKVRVYGGTSDRISTGTVGWVSNSYLKPFDPTNVPANAYYEPASERAQRQWTDALPNVCKDTTIAQIDIKNPEKTGAKYIFSTKVDSEGGNFFIITIDGSIDPFSETGQAIMKHECGHVLMTKYDQEFGRTAWRAFLDRGWPNREASRVENLADCIADELGATRGGVGYGTKCTPAQKQLAKELVDMYAPDAREN